MNIMGALQAALDSAARAGHELCLVIDTAGAENSHAMLDMWQVEYLSLFDGTPEESLLEIAPLLVPVNKLDDALRKRLFEWAQKLAYTQPCLSWIETSAAPNELAEHLRRYHVVGLSDNQALLLRWYDTRILPVWFSCLTPEEAASFTARSFGWSYVDRMGDVSAMTLAQQPSAFPSAPPFGRPLITLTDAQYGMLVDATELDVLLKHMRQVIRDELKRVPERELTRFVSTHQQAAISKGLDDIDRQAQFLTIALYTSGKGVEHPAFEALMTQPAPTLDDLAKGIQELPEEVLETGPPLWDATAAHAKLASRY